MNIQDRDLRRLLYLTLNIDSLEVLRINNETEKDPVGLLGMEAFLSPVSCRQDSSLHDLP